jgi:hypothetical protein
MLTVLVLVTAAASAQGPQAKDTQSQNKLWAAISVTTPVRDLDAFTTDPFKLSFGLVNDTAKTINPEIDSAVILVNGKELKERTGYLIALRDDRWEALPPGDDIGFSKNVGEYFEKPGIYKVVWKGKNFQSPEIVFRVVGKNKK